MGEKRFNITDDNVERFIRETIGSHDGFLGKVERYAVENEIPVLDNPTARLLEIICRLLMPGRILELGTAIGFSTLLMCESTGGKAVIDTVEIDPEMSAAAAKNISKSGYAGNVNHITADAADFLQNIDKRYDLILIDAAKGQYNDYYRFCSDMIKPGGIIFADNVLYRGMTAGGAEVSRRQRLLVKRLRRYIKTAVEDSRFVTDVIPIGDGVCISYRKRECNGNEK
jgi:predicted O-methyltransferase YrrM